MSVIEKVFSVHMLLIPCDDLLDLNPPHFSPGTYKGSVLTSRPDCPAFPILQRLLSAPSLPLVDKPDVSFLCGSLASGWPPTHPVTGLGLDSGLICHVSRGGFWGMVWSNLKLTSKLDEQISDWWQHVGGENAWYYFYDHIELMTLSDLTIWSLNGVCIYRVFKPPLLPNRFIYFSYFDRWPHCSWSDSWCTGQKGQSVCGKHPDPVLGLSCTCSDSSIVWPEKPPYAPQLGKGVEFRKDRDFCLAGLPPIKGNLLTLLLSSASDRRWLSSRTARVPEVPSISAESCSDHRRRQDGGTRQCTLYRNHSELLHCGKSVGGL